MRSPRNSRLEHLPLPPLEGPHSQSLSDPSQHSCIAALGLGTPTTFSEALTSLSALGLSFPICKMSGRCSFYFCLGSPLSTIESCVVKLETDVVCG